MPPGESVRSAPAMSPSLAAHGEMWIMLQHTIASADATGQETAVTSRCTGAKRFAKPIASRCAAILESAAASGSLGCQISDGSASAK
jgi:hypothetical protein